MNSPFIDNIWGADLVDIQLINKFNERIGFLFCFIDIFSIYAWVIPFTEKKEYRISKYKNIFAKGYVPNLSKEVFVIKKVKRTVP